MIRYPQAMYLKSTGNKMDVKVSIKIIDKFPYIFIRDQEFTTFNKALVCLQHIVENELVSPSNADVLETEVAA